ncbi:MAG: hypothetical protein CMG46_02290 [Candidatus Marinimicrobia bacterium]|nr:hypothetical protein [Candidatus Neomarinimicrobiota bacterium]|tara:strand:+ start:349 stop:672 length:324 start_codon:yes stop_codon:yes gene_type:complete
MDDKKAENTLLNTITELILFYVKQNYEDYLIKKNINSIPNSDISNVVNQLYTDRKKHIKGFILNSLKELYHDNYPGDVLVNSIIFDIFSDDDICKQRLITEIINYQS